MVKLDDQLQSQSPLPLLSKPDRMESFMKQITRDPNISRWRCIFSFGRKQHERVPLKASVMEDDNKSYLLDRVESLEDRLIQLSLDIETRRASLASTATPTLSLPVSSYPVFNNHKPKCKHVSSSDILPISTGGELQELEHEQKQKQKNGNNNINNQKAKNGKKKAHSWPHLKILGC